MYDKKIFTQSTLVVATETVDLQFTDERAVSAGNNVVGIDNGAGTTYYFQVLRIVGTSASGTTTLTAASSATQLFNCTSGSVIVNLPTANTCVDKLLTIKKTDASANTVTITANYTDNIDGAATFVLSSQWDAVTIQSDGSTRWVIHSRSPGGGIAPSTANYLVVGSVPGTLPNARQITNGNNIFLTDGGAGTTETVEAFTTSTGVTSTTLTNTSNTVQLVDATGGTQTITLPAATFKKTFLISKTDATANTVVITRAGSDTIMGATTFTLYTRYQSIILCSDGVSVWYPF